MTIRIVGSLVLCTLMSACGGELVAGQGAANSGSSGPLGGGGGGGGGGFENPGENNGDAGTSPLIDGGSTGTVTNVKRPPDFTVNGKSAIYTEILSGEATLTIDVTARTARAKGKLEVNIRQANGGSPVFDIAVPSAQFVTIDGAQKVALATVKSPDAKSEMRMVDSTLAPGKHTLEVEEYALRTGRSTYNQTFLDGIDFTRGFEFLTDHDDLYLRYFTERYFPAGFECDRYPFKVTVVVLNAPAAARPEVLAHGMKTVSADGKTFTIEYPRGSTSSWFLHVIDRATWTLATGEYKSIDGRSIPLSAHSRVQAEAAQAIADMKAMFPQLEADYGPYPHDSALVSIGSSNDPMEYDAAMQTDMDLDGNTPADRGALGHEMSHMWFGRSAHPVSGRDGWVDEAVAQWRDDGYPRSTSITLTGTYAVLAVGSPYQRETPDAAYEQGSELLANLDFLLKDRGGVKPVLKAFHVKYKDQLYTTENFLEHLRTSAADLKEQMQTIFHKKVYTGAAVPQKPGAREDDRGRDFPRHPG
ncbi:MAG: hypothetical protein ACT4TC_26780, partial [Myxococcaceae bacterium]